MLLVRPVRVEDHADLLDIARQAGIAMSSLPQDSHVLEMKIDRAVKSFAGKPDHPQGEAFLMVLEDTDTGKIAGTAGLIAHVGIRRPFYSYKLSTIVQASDKLGVYSLNHVLHMVNDYTGASELGSLFVTPEYRRDGIGKFLSRCRHLMLAEFPYIFANTVISEIRGVQSVKGESPFYNAVGKHFFLMDFKRSDFIYATQGGQFIADLMPRYPVYVKLLPPDAQAVIGVPFDASLPAKRMLEDEGFTHEGYVDVFDAGPTLQAEREQIRTVRESRKVKVAAVEKTLDAPLHFVANGVLSHFCIARAPLVANEKGATIDQKTANCLGVTVGDEVRYGI